MKIEEIKKKVNVRLLKLVDTGDLNCPSGELACCLIVLELNPQQALGRDVRSLCRIKPLMVVSSTLMDFARHNPGDVDASGRPTDGGFAVSH